MPSADFDELVADLELVGDVDRIEGLIATEWPENPGNRAVSFTVCIRGALFASTHCGTPAEIASVTPLWPPWATNQPVAWPNPDPMSEVRL